MRVGVVDKLSNPLMPCHQARARKLLAQGRAEVVCPNPFTIRLLDREGGELQETEVKIDPGSKTTGVAVAIKGSHRGWFVVMAFEITHRGHAVSLALTRRAALRGGGVLVKSGTAHRAFPIAPARRDGWRPPCVPGWTTPPPL